MNFVQRAIGVVTQPKTELPRAAAEPATNGSLIGGYAAILAALPAIGALLGMLLAAGRMLGYVIGSFLVSAILIYLLRDLGVTILVGVILAALAPNFGGQANKINAMKLAVYAATPIWIMGFLAGLLVFGGPALSYLLTFLAFGYAGYLIYLGCRPMLGVPDNQAPAVAGVTTVIWLVLYIIVQVIVQQIAVGVMTSSVTYSM